MNSMGQMGQMDQTNKSNTSQFYENYLKQVNEGLPSREANILSPISERSKDAYSTEYATIESEATIRRMDPADERPINSTGTYNTADANERTVRSMAGSDIKTVHSLDQPLISNPNSLSEEDRPIRASGAYNYKNQGMKDLPNNASPFEEKKYAQPTFDDEDDDYSDYEDDFESDEEDEDDNAVHGDIGSTPNLGKVPSVN